jgi:hypothetical protein
MRPVYNCIKPYPEVKSGRHLYLGTPDKNMYESFMQYLLAIYYVPEAGNKK